jgi:hypothetical protein
MRQEVWMNEFETIAGKYFDAFHAGRLDEVSSYFAEAGVVKYGTEAEKPATLFFPQTRDMISKIAFETHGIYSSEQTSNVIIHFSFAMSGADGVKKTEAIDIIEFDEHRKIVRITVIPNGEAGAA